MSCISNFNALGPAGTMRADGISGVARGLTSTTGLRALLLTACSDKRVLQDVFIQFGAAEQSHQVSSGLILSP
jgi:hypothetical protein